MALFSPSSSSLTSVLLWYHFPPSSVRMTSQCWTPGHSMRMVYILPFWQDIVQGKTVRSLLASVTHGVPKGSVLDPLLFINDLFLLRNIVFIFTLTTPLPVLSSLPARKPSWSYFIEWKDTLSDVSIDGQYSLCHPHPVHLTSSGYTQVLVHALEQHSNNPCLWINGMLFSLISTQNFLTGSKLYRTLQRE